MIVPSERVVKEMHSEAASMWVIPSSDKEYKSLIIIKIPSASIKAIISGCNFDISFSLKNNILVYALRVYDTPDNPLMISGIVTILEEILSIVHLVKEKKTQLFIFNELDICIGWSNISLQGDDEDLIEKLKLSNHTISKYDKECQYVLDCLCFSMDKEYNTECREEIKIYTFGISIDEWRVNTNIIIGEYINTHLRINDENEGGMFELTALSSLESLFPNAIYKSPQVKIGKKTREFTDILACDDNGAILIESKDLSVIKSGFNRTMTRRVSGVQKQAKTAIGQLVGACNAMARGEIIFDSNGNEINIKRDAPHHCVILVTEIIHSGSWYEVEQRLVNAFKETKCFYHLLDLRELMAILKFSKFDPNLLRINLVNRFKKFIEYKSVHIRTENKR